MDNSYAGRLKHAAALLALSITEEERGERGESLMHAQQSQAEIRNAMFADDKEHRS